MTHYNYDIRKQKQYLHSCGYSYTYLNKLTTKQIYKLYRETEKTKGFFGI